MANLPSRSPSAQRNPIPPVQLLRVTCEAGIPDLIAGHAVLVISVGDETDSNTTCYWLRADVDHAGHIISCQLTKFASGERYNLPADLSDCDCADHTCREERPLGCKHMRALREALLQVVEAQDAEPIDLDERWTIVEAVASDDDQVVDLDQRWTITDVGSDRESA
jgi:hypothetical protein